MRPTQESLDAHWEALRMFIPKFRVYAGVLTQIQEHIEEYIEANMRTPQYIEQLEGKLLRMQSEKDKLAHKLRTQHAAETQGLRAKLADMTDDCNRYKDTADLHQNRTDQLLQQKMELQETLSKTSDDLKWKNLEVVRLGKDLTECIKDMQAFKAKDFTRQKQHDELTSTNQYILNEVKQLQEQIMQQEKRAARQVELKEEAVRDATGKAWTFQTKNKQLKVFNNTLKAQNDRLKEELAAARERIRLLEGERGCLTPRPDWEGVQHIVDDWTVDLKKPSARIAMEDLVEYAQDKARDAMLCEAKYFKIEHVVLPYCSPTDAAGGTNVQRVTFFHPMGFDSSVPVYLRTNSTLKCKPMCLLELVSFIFDFYIRKLRNETDDRVWELSEFLPSYLSQKFTVEPLKVEFMYNFIYSLQLVSNNPVVALFYRMLIGEAGFWFYEDQRVLINAFRSQLVEGHTPPAPTPFKRRQSVAATPLKSALRGGDDPNGFEDAAPESVSPAPPPQTPVRSPRTPLSVTINDTPTSTTAATHGSRTPSQMSPRSVGSPRGSSKNQPASVATTGRMTVAEIFGTIDTLLTSHGPYSQLHRVALQHAIYSEYPEAHHLTTNKLFEISATGHESKFLTTLRHIHLSVMWGFLKTLETRLIASARVRNAVEVICPSDIKKVLNDMDAEQPADYVDEWMYKVISCIPVDDEVLRKTKLSEALRRYPVPKQVAPAATRFPTQDPYPDGKEIQNRLAAAGVALTVPSPATASTALKSWKTITHVNKFKNAALSRVRSEASLKKAAATQKAKHTPVAEPEIQVANVPTTRVTVGVDGAAANMMKTKGKKPPHLDLSPASRQAVHVGLRIESFQPPVETGAGSRQAKARRVVNILMDDLPLSVGEFILAARRVPLKPTAKYCSHTL
eukprot:NODE_78_length_2805_cov_67.170650_g74_i0.p1 GENE.NODE_78_length_2805_cov_67.170650_g74_i0~~NODE_78_length_2805_cov_67.170650_g74_i0.p1  ORF type:complete len:928 (-),score=252.46 NODE_78_length_2805_cov_67.170650_g74_i0:22-2736(-)